MSTVTEILGQAMALSAPERASLAQSLIRSLPPGPPIFHSEEQLSAELQSRLSAIDSGAKTQDAASSLRRAREAVKRVGKP